MKARCLPWSICNPRTAPRRCCSTSDFRVGAGEVVTLLGRNGMGKTTTIQTIMGLLPATGGSAVFDDLPLVGLPPHRIAQAGLGLVPEGRQIFPTLTVEENLIATAASRFAAPRWTLDAIYDFFPNSPDGGSTWATSCPGVNSRCWRSGAP